jgi:hypothetical protein
LTGLLDLALAFPDVNQTSNPDVGFQKRRYPIVVILFCVLEQTGLIYKVTTFSPLRMSVFSWTPDESVDQDVSFCHLCFDPLNWVRSHPQEQLASLLETDCTCPSTEQLYDEVTTTEPKVSPQANGSPRNNACSEDAREITLETTTDDDETDRDVVRNAPKRRDRKVALDTVLVRGLTEIAQRVIKGMRVTQLIRWFRQNGAPPMPEELKRISLLVYDRIDYDRSNWRKFMITGLGGVTNVRLMCGWFLVWRPEVLQSLSVDLRFLVKRLNASCKHEIEAVKCPRYIKSSSF